MGSGQDVFADFDPAHRIDKGQIEPHVGQLSAGFMGDEFGNGAINAFKLRGGQTGRGAREIPGFLDLDHDQPISVAQHQIKFTA